MLHVVAIAYRRSEAPPNAHETDVTEEEEKRPDAFSVQGRVMASALQHREPCGRDAMPSTLLLASIRSEPGT
jgi:hypothetical protein